MTTHKTSTEGTEFVLKLTQDCLVHTEKRLEVLKTTDELTVFVSTGSGALDVKDVTIWKNNRNYQFHGEEVRDGTYKFSDGTIAENWTNVTFMRAGYKGVPSQTSRHFVFEDERQKQIAQTENFIKSLKKDIEFFKRKIAEWKPEAA